MQLEKRKKKWVLWEYWILCWRVQLVLDGAMGLSRAAASLFGFLFWVSILQIFCAQISVICTESNFPLDTWKLLSLYFQLHCSGTFLLSLTHCPWDRVCSAPPLEAWWVCRPDTLWFLCAAGLVAWLTLPAEVGTLLGSTVSGKAAGWKLVRCMYVWVLALHLTWANHLIPFPVTVFPFVKWGS